MVGTLSLAWCKFEVAKCQAILSIKYLKSKYVGQGEFDRRPELDKFEGSTLSFWLVLDRICRSTVVFFLGCNVVEHKVP